MTTAVATDPIHANMELAISAGLSVFPCDGNKQPDVRYLPRGEDGRPTNKPFFIAPPGNEIIGRWLQSPIVGYGIACGPVSGGLLVIDCETRAAFEQWLAAVGDLADGLPIQETPGGGIHVFLCVDVPPAEFLYRNDKLAWEPDESEKSGRKISIETRAAGGYIMGPGSDHPNGGKYRLVRGTLDNIPRISKARADALLDAARRLDKCPLTRQQSERMHKAIERKEIARAANNGSAGVIDTFNERFGVRDVLRNNGYTVGDRARMLRPGAEADSQPGVVFFDRGGVEVCFAWSSNDLLNDGHCHSPFSVFCKLEHGDDCKAAVKAAAQLLGIEGRHDHRIRGYDGEGVHSEKTSASDHADERGLILMRADTVERTAVEWGWPGWLPFGKIVLLFGFPDVGKGALSVKIVSTFSAGGEWPDGTRAPICSSLILSKEDDASDTIAPRLDAAGADCSRVYFLNGVNELGEDGKCVTRWFTLDMIAHVRDMLKKHPDIRLLVIDPPGSHMPEKLSDNNQSHVRSLLGPWAELAQEFKIIVLLIMHRPKSGGAKAINGAIGSGAWLAAARVGVMVARDGEDPNLRLMLRAKNNLCAPMPNRSFRIAGPVAHVEWGAEIETTADEVTFSDMAGKPGPEPKKLEAAKEWLAAELAGFLPTGVETLKKNAKDAAIGWRTVQRASGKLGVKVDRCQFGGGYTWRLPKP
jgi:AAA domain/Bifunctional DNA primase/polymerase, N-terminal